MGAPTEAGQVVQGANAAGMREMLVIKKIDQ